MISESFCFADYDIASQRRGFIDIFVFQFKQFCPSSNFSCDCALSTSNFIA